MRLSRSTFESMQETSQRFIREGYVILDSKNRDHKLYFEKRPSDDLFFEFVRTHLAATTSNNSNSRSGSKFGDLFQDKGPGEDESSSRLRRWWDATAKLGARRARNDPFVNAVEGWIDTAMFWLLFPNIARVVTEQQQLQLGRRRRRMQHQQKVEHDRKQELVHFGGFNMLIRGDELEHSQTLHCDSFEWNAFVIEPKTNHYTLDIVPGSHHLFCERSNPLPKPPLPAIPKNRVQRLTLGRNQILVAFDRTIHSGGESRSVAGGKHQTISVRDGYTPEDIELLGHCKWFGRPNEEELPTDLALQHYVTLGWNGTSTKASFEAGIVYTKAFFCVGDKATTTKKKKCTFDKLLKEMKEGGVAMIKERIDCLSKEFENGEVGSGRHKRAKKCLIALEFT
eukprot:CAMPEP_0183720172 /NCGR_PEP_ID=MMETSP0737-20130205/12864_1 /TAXON_ID=385413 /ORGANISM="Thalassiosira miniscula, Strain CCMP1093" /LENGTH=395 /DNA_ID=CAMNT_0025949999 /DNA_START=12 /DNA_END=1199 /DNA_ORIENTATION=+